GWPGLSPSSSASAATAGTKTAAGPASPAATTTSSNPRTPTRLRSCSSRLTLGSSRLCSPAEQDVVVHFPASAASGTLGPGGHRETRAAAGRDTIMTGPERHAGLEPKADERPWEGPGAVRRDCAPHRGSWFVLLASVNGFGIAVAVAGWTLFY